MQENAANDGNDYDSLVCRVLFAIRLATNIQSHKGEFMPAAEPAFKHLGTAELQLPARSIKTVVSIAELVRYPLLII